MNLFTLKLNDREAAVNWRNVVFLAEYYWKVSASLSSGSALPIEHFPHTIHLILREEAQIETAWNWEVFDKITGTEILMAFAYTICCGLHRGDAVDKMKECALTGQCKFHVVRDKVAIIAMRIQFTEHIIADDKAIGYSALQEAEEIMSIITLLQSKTQGKVENAAIREVLDITRAVADVSAADAEDESPSKPKDKKESNQRMLDITIKIARMFLMFPETLTALRFLEQRWGKVCLCDSAAKLEKVIQQCGGSDSAHLGTRAISYYTYLAPSPPGV